MADYQYIGVIRFQNQWRIFGDNSSRKKWSLIKPFENYVASFIELSHQEIKHNLSASWITFVVNFDERIFVDNGGDDTYFLPVDDSLPPDWYYLTDSPIVYIPENLGNLWLGKVLNLEDGRITISPASFAAIHSDDNWRFFMGFDASWVLDFASFMNRPNYPKWPSAKVYSDFRQDLPLVDETNKADFLQKVKDYELSIEEIPNLRLALDENQQWQLAILKEDIERYAGTQNVKNIQALIDAITKPHLSTLIDFDKKTVVQQGKAFTPAHWSLYLENPIQYLPEEMREWWR